MIEHLRKVTIIHRHKTHMATGCGKKKNLNKNSSLLEKCLLRPARNYPQVLRFALHLCHTL